MTKAHQKFLMIARRTLLEADSLRELSAALAKSMHPSQGRSAHGRPAAKKRLGRKNSLLSRKGQRSV